MLDAYFKHYFWTFTLLVLFGAAFLSARTVNAFLGEALAPGPEDLTRGQAGPVRRKAAEQAAGIPTSALLERNLFKAERENIAPVPVGPAGGAAEAVAAKTEFNLDSCSASSLGANLLATFLDTRDPEASMAVFQDTSPDQKTIGVRVGDRLLDQAEVKVIDWREVYVDNGGKCESFSLEEEAKARTVAAAPPPSAPPEDGEGDLGEGIKKMSDSEYTIPRQEIDNVLSNLNQVATQARIVPSFSNGKANGFKLFSIRPNSLYSKIGIQNGDIVQKINGYEINSPDKALEIYSKLKDAQSITVDLVRRGKQQTLSYSIR